jgi:Sulfotransferase domain
VYETLKTRTPPRWKRGIVRSTEGLSALSGDFRMLPQFVIIGGGRSGTNSLYNYLNAHPDVRRWLPIAEFHFFDLNFDRGMRWYRGHFPARASAAIAGRRTGRKQITGEATPYYIFHPLAPHRIATYLPGVKLFVVLRNPVERAYSHYRHEVALGRETLSFNEALDRESERLDGEESRMLADPSYLSYNHQRYSYVARGIYADQLTRLFSLFPREDVMLILNDDLLAEPAEVCRKAVAFLDLPPHAMSSFPRYNMGRPGSMDPLIRQRLVEGFADSNARLRDWLGADPPWD